MESISTGTIIGGRYKVLALIGDGSMGAVYRVEETDTHETLALKALHPDWSRHPEIIARFEREAIAASRIDHPNVVHATDFGCSSDGSFYLVQEYVDGRELRALLQEGPVEAGRAVQIMRGVVAGIRAAHEKGIIHRDLKPENIMLVERDGNPDFVRLLDFGVARLESANNPQSGMQALTVAGRPLGTPEYMSPEQVLGKAVDARTDLYSLGVIFYELLAGVCPFDGNVPRLLQQHLTAEPPELPPEVAARHSGLARIVRILMAKDPKKRFQSAAELAEALNASAAGQARPRAPVMEGPRKGEGQTFGSLVAMRASLAKKRLVGIVAPQARRHGSSWRAGAIATACVAALVAVIVVVITRDKSEPVPATAPDPKASARAEPARVDPGATPSAATDATKGAASKSRRKTPESSTPSKTKAK
jgi:serine/threonine-protein kinase